MTVVMGLDLSLTSSGVARISTSPTCPDCGAQITTSGGRHAPRCIAAVCRYTGPGNTSARVTVSRVESKTRARRKGDPPPTLTERSARLRKIAGKVTNLCADADLVVVEGPAFSKAEAGVWDRAGLWWLIVARLTGAGLNVVEVSPTVVKTYALGKGSGAGTGKDEVLAAVIRRYMPVVEVPGNNEADALVLAAMGARFAGLPIEPGPLPQTHARAIASVRWTPTT